jgi:hypothetical protein
MRARMCRGKYTRTRGCCACLLLNARARFVLHGFVPCTRVWVYVHRKRHARARMLRVPTFECTHALCIVWPCVFHARMRVCVEASTRARVVAARACF